MSTTAREHLEDEARAYWDAEVYAAWEGISALRLAAGFATPGVEGLRADLEGASVPAVLAEVRRLERLAWALLEHPEAPAFEDRSGATDDYGGPPTCLEYAQHALDEAWRILTAAVRRTRSLRALMALALAGGRIATVRARMWWVARPTAAPAYKSRRPRPAALLSLTRAAHAPPHAVEIPASVLIAGGGPL